MTNFFQNLAPLNIAAFIVVLPIMIFHVLYTISEKIHHPERKTKKSAS